jgi:pyruvate-ferredoxin/flavodoxin oxidoreductase
MTAKHIIALDRTKEPGSIGEPLFQDAVTAFAEAGRDVKIIGGRYGLSSKEFTPGMVKAVFDHVDGEGFHGFTVGIEDDVTFKSLKYSEVNLEPEDVVSCLFWGLGADGTVGAAKNSVKIIGGNTDKNSQAYFVYDSKKSGGVTVSHLRFGDSTCNYPYLITSANFISCSNDAYLGRYDMLSSIKENGIFLLNTEATAEEVFDKLTKEEQQIIIDRKVKFYIINAIKIAAENGLGRRTNTVMQTAFFKLSGILPEEQSIDLIKTAIEKTFSKKGMDIVEMNWKCVDAARSAVQEVAVPTATTANAYVAKELITEADGEFANKIMKPVMLLKGDDVPVSAMTFDGVIPTGTTKVEKRGVAPRVPMWISDNCIQCNQCAHACPHAAVRAKQIEPASLENAPASFNVLKSKTKNDKDLQYKLQVYVEDCTGCGVCIDVCPAKEKALAFDTLENQRASGETTNAEFFEALPNNILDGTKIETVKGSQFKTPLFEFSGACAGCGETPYVKLVTQLFGNRMIIANATGCSSIYGGTFPAIPYCTDDRGHGPAFANSLFEDNAEFGFGMRLAVDTNRKLLKAACETLLTAGTTPELTEAITAQLAVFNQKDDEAIEGQAKIASLLDAAKAQATGEAAAALTKIEELKDYFVDKSVWIFGGDGWAYDIGYGGVDHVVSQNKNVNILVMDTEVYSNTGGQASKATPIGAVAKFANGGMQLGKKLMPFMCMSYGHVYVAHVNMGANRNQLQKAMVEAEAHDGPSIIFAYSPCIAHGINMMTMQTEAKKATECGYWPLFRYNPALEDGKRFVFESKDPKGSYQDFIRSERRYTALFKTNPSHAEEIFKASEADAIRRWNFYKNLGNIL